MEDSAVATENTEEVNSSDQETFHTKRNLDEPANATGSDHERSTNGTKRIITNTQSAPAEAAEAAVDNSFLASMTFAMPANTTLEGRRVGGCDCDECGGSAYIPQAIVDAIRKHKRQKHETMPLKRSQHRALLKRHHHNGDTNNTGMAVYEWIMPLNAEPLVEFGNTHRIIWIRRLPDVLKTIGKGIVGSQQEEEKRQILESWKQGDLYFVPSNGGKAIALIHSPAETENEIQSSPLSRTTGGSSTGGHAILYICKIPLSSQTSNDLDCGDNKDDESNEKEWYDILQSTCQQVLENFQNENPQIESSMQYQKISEEKSSLLTKALSNLK